MRSRYVSDFHFPFFISVLFLCIVGVFNLYSASHQSAHPQWLYQIYWLFMGLGVAGLMTFLDYRIFERLGYPLYFINLFLLLLVMLIGPRIYGAHRWIDLGFMRLQPSELMKISLVLVLAQYFHADRNVGGYRLVGLIRPMMLLGMAAALVVIEPDLGTTLLLCFIAGSIFMFVKIKWQSLLILAVIGALSAPLAYHFALKDYQKDRVKTFLNPSRDPRGKGYHALQSMIAVGSGKFYGKGHMKGSQTQLAFLPEQHTDFVFSVFAEEHGFVGVTLFLIIYIVMIFMGLDISKHARDKFGAILGFGITSIFFWQAFINIGMVIGVLPVVGITLPFFSYGGSSLIISMMGVGVLLSIHLRRFIF
ncbi:MAG: rod shape-determining protein RodA [Deltaproteobacteria bacterium]|nr:rod shape-determining protein RodA [Deltaproteobacteria bacterium]